MFSWFKLSPNLGPAKTAKISGFEATTHISQSTIEVWPSLTALGHRKSFKGIMMGSVWVGFGASSW